MIRTQRRDLVRIIAQDLVHCTKIPLILLFVSLISAIFVVTTVHRTRLLTSKREQLVLEHNALDIEWRNLLLEENSLGDHSRVERIAIEKLHMQHVNLLQENIIIKQ